MDDKLQSMRNLVIKLNAAGQTYYQESREIMSNFEYDKLYDELQALEEETGITLSDSPTIHVGYELLSELPKEKHDSSMLSLDKTKEVLVLKEWLKDKKGLLSWKLDGLTIVLTYNNGELVKAVTRGNGEVGEVITNNARTFKNIPLKIAYKGLLVLRGEAVIKYSDFIKINEQIEDIDAKYKNPRNLCSGSVRQLNNQITAKRNVNFFAFSLVSVEGVEFNNSRAQQMNWLSSLGFDVVDSQVVDAQSIEEVVKQLSEQIIHNDFPSDGLVLIYDDIKYGYSLGSTAKFPRDSIAFKWADEIMETTLEEIEWSASRTGLINPVAIFEPVELEGTTVSRASLHNISIMEALELGIGDKIQVYKANMIIPQIANNLTRSGNMPIPEKCPVCNGITKIKNDFDVKSLYCTNVDCLAKKIKSFTHFVSRDAMNMEGLSEATIEKLIAKGMITELADLFHVEKFKDEIIVMEGFGEKSFANLIVSINRARNTTLPRLIYSLGISNVGLSNAKLICKELGNDLERIRRADKETLVEIPGVGPMIAETFVAFFEKEANNQIIDDILKEITLEKAEETTIEQIFKDINFVITGSVTHFENRNEVKAIIEAKGGKVTGQVTSKTNYLINNDNLSSSSKNKKAKALQIPIITEEEFMTMLE
jgi:DNA ligase (NAD+)